MRPRLRPNGPLSVVVVLWGFNFVSVKLLYREMEPGAVAVIRFLLMWATLWIVCAATGRMPKIDKRDRGRVLFSGFLSMGLYMSLFLAGMSLTTPAEGAIILASAPVMTYALAVATGREPLIWAALAGTLLAFSGVALIVGASLRGHGTPLGNVLIFLSAAVWAISALTMRPLVGKYDSLAVLTYSMPGALPALLVFGAAATLRFDPSHLTWVGWTNLAQVVLLSGVMGFASFYRGVAQVGPAAATSYQFCTPVAAAFFGWICFGKLLPPVGWLGVAAVLGGVAMTSVVRTRAAR